MKEELRILGLDEIVTCQKCLDLRLLTVISWGYHCQDKIKPPLCVKGDKDLYYRLFNGNHRAVSEYLFYDRITALVHDPTSTIEERPTRHLTELGIYKNILKEDGTICQPYLKDKKFRSLEEIPEWFFSNIQELLTHKGFSPIQESFQLK